VNTHKLEWLVNYSLKHYAPDHDVHIHGTQVDHDHNAVVSQLWIDGKRVNNICATLSDTFSDIVGTLENQALNATYLERAYQRQEE